jgi:class 3 adenylate cyclase
MKIDAALGARLVALAAGMGLLVAGIDLRLTPDGAWCCFESTPPPTSRSTSRPPASRSRR